MSYIHSDGEELKYLLPDLPEGIKEFAIALLKEDPHKAVVFVENYLQSIATVQLIKKEVVKARSNDI